MNPYPTLRWLAQHAQDPEYVLLADADEVLVKRVVTELRALLAERAQAVPVASPTPPPRLREYKGVTYHDERWWIGDIESYSSAANVIALSGAPLTDDDHAPLLALKADPFLPVETLESVVMDWALGVGVYTDQVADLCVRVRAHLAQQAPPRDAENSYPSKELMQETGEIIRAEFRKSLTTTECVARLVELGARDISPALAMFRDSHGYTERVSHRRLLIIPTEETV